jgi:hypothetical protein
MKDLSEVLENIHRLSYCKDPNDWVEVDERRCDYCAEIREQVHICDCWLCSAPFGYCTCPSPWKKRIIN